MEIIIKNKEQIDKAKEDKIRESGDLIQPNDKDAFVERFGYHPNEKLQDVRKFLKKKGLGNKIYPDYGSENDNRDK